MLFPQGDNVQRFYERVPDELMGQRLADYNTLRRHRYSDWEATKIITTLTIPDKDGNRYLQALDLNTEAWRVAMNDRLNWYTKKMKRLLRKGLSRSQARRRIAKELLRHYEPRKGDTRKDPTPWDSIREVYKIKQSPKTSVDFIDNLRKREQNYRKKNLPFSVTAR